MKKLDVISTKDYFVNYFADEKAVTVNYTEDDNGFEVTIECPNYTFIWLKLNIEKQYSVAKVYQKYKDRMRVRWSKESATPVNSKVRGLPDEEVAVIQPLNSFIPLFEEAEDEAQFYSFVYQGWWKHEQEREDYDRSQKLHTGYGFGSADGGAEPRVVSATSKNKSRPFGIRG